MVIYQTNSLSLYLEIFKQPCAEQRKSLVEQSEEITVESLLESNDSQPLGNKLRFLVAPLFKKEKRCKKVCRNTRCAFFFFIDYKNRLIFLSCDILRISLIYAFSTSK